MGLRRRRKVSDPWIPVSRVRILKDYGTQIAQAEKANSALEKLRKSPANERPAVWVDRDQANPIYRNGSTL